MPAYQYNPNLNPTVNKKPKLQKWISDKFEILKSKLNKNYTLNKNSPDSLFKNKELILRTLKKDFSARNTLSRINFTIINEKDDIDFQKEIIKCAMLSESPLPSLDTAIYNPLFADEEFSKQLTEYAIKSNYQISKSSPLAFCSNPTLVERYYHNLLDNSINIKNDLFSESLIRPNLLSNPEFLSNYINILSEKNIDSDTIVNSLLRDDNCINVIKNNPELFNIVFENTKQNNLKDFFKRFYTDEELSKLLITQENDGSKLSRLSELYKKDPYILNDLKGPLLEQRYSNIPSYKMQIIARNPIEQETLINMNNYEYLLYSKMTTQATEKTDKWNRFDNNILKSFSSKNYQELLNDLYDKAQAGDKINSKDIETLTMLFSKNSGKNDFNITTKKELEHYNEIKELVCDTIIDNPQLDNIDASNPLNKYLDNFRNLSEIDKTKFALLEKYYDINLKEAEEIVNMYGTDIESIPIKNQDSKNTIMQLKAIKDIYQCDNIDTLKEIGSLDFLIENDLSTSLTLTEKSKEIFEELYKENLYSPTKEDLINTVSYNGKNINVYDAKTDFSMIIKTVGKNLDQSPTPNEGKYNDNWNSLTKESERNQVLRYYTCTSYMTDENLKTDKDSKNKSRYIILGFANNTKNYSIDGFFTQDVHSKFVSNDDIYNDYTNSTYMSPSELESKTSGPYNELVLNTLHTDKNGNTTKLQPNYLIYIKESNIDMEQDILFEETKRAASEFGVPIVIIDKEKVQESEKQKIEKMSQEIDENSKTKDISKYTNKVRHYKYRYDDPTIEEYAPKDKINELNTILKNEDAEKEKHILLPNIPKQLSYQDKADKKAELLKKQQALKDANIISGEER